MQSSLRQHGPQTPTRQAPSAAGPVFEDLFRNRWDLIQPAA
jgi:hypothetical protein